MYTQLRLTIFRESGQRKMLNALLALLTGILALSWPNLLYYIVGGYLLALGLLFYYYRIHPFVTAFPLLTALLIFILPEFIPFTLAFFLGIFGFILLFSFYFTVLGIISLILAGFILSYPGSVAYFIAFFLLLYGFTNIIYLLQESRKEKID